MSRAVQHGRFHQTLRNRLHRRAYQNQVHHGKTAGKNNRHPVIIQMQKLCVDNIGRDHTSVKQHGERCKKHNRVRPEHPLDRRHIRYHNCDQESDDRRRNTVNNCVQISAPDLFVLKYHIIAVKVKSLDARNHSRLRHHPGRVGKRSADNMPDRHNTDHNHKDKEQSIHRVEHFSTDRFFPSHYLSPFPSEQTCLGILFTHLIGKNQQSKVNQRVE